MSPKLRLISATGVYPVAKVVVLAVHVLSNSTPTVSNGTQVWSCSVKPQLDTSKINLAGTFTFDSGLDSRTLIVMLFRGSVCIGVTEAYLAKLGRAVPVAFNITDSPASTATQTYSIRVGINQTGTWYVNQAATPYFNGMLAKNGITVSELS